MTSENLSQSGQAVDLGKYIIGHKAYFYKPPSMNKTITRGRRAKHIDHYVGPGIITKHIGTRSMVIRYNEKDFQRDAGMILLEKTRMEAEDPTIADRLIIGLQALAGTMEATQPLQEGEFVIIKDDPNTPTWYCAEIRKVLADRIEVNYYITIGSIKLPRGVNYTKEGTAGRGKLSKNMVFGQRQGFAHHDTAFHEPW
jgi:hypothetical protein